MSVRWIITLAAAGSAALLLGAWGFQYLGGMAPCKLCYWQRYPHQAAVLIGLMALIWPRVWLAIGGGVAAATTAAIGAYHSGVEAGFWQGPTSCTSAAVSGLSAEDLMARIMAAPLVRCDDIAWQMAGISMAGWNALMSLVLCAVWLWAAWSIYAPKAAATFPRR